MDVQIASRLANRRREAGLSQEALAAKLGVSRQAVSKWERSEASPDTDNLIALAALYGVTLDELLYGTDEQDSGSAEPEANTAEATDAEQGDDPDDAACKAADHTQNAADAEQGDGPDDAACKAADHTQNADAASDTDGAADASSGASSKDHVSIGWDGIHVSKPGEEVHVSWDGIHVDDEAKNEHVHIDRKGLHAQDAKGHSVESDGAGGVIVDGVNYASWREAREKLGPDLGSTSPFLRTWNRIPYGAFVAIVVVVLGLSTGTWLPALLLLTISIYHALGRSIDRRSLVPLMKRLIAMGLLAWVIWMCATHM